MGFLLSHAHSTQGDLWDVARKKCCLLNFGIVLDWTWMSVLWWRLLCPSSTSRYTGLIYGDSTILPIFFKKNWQYALVSKLYRGVPLFQYSITLKLSYARSNYKKKKKKKIAWNLSSWSSSSMQFFFFFLVWSLHTRFRELYSDILKPYSGVFLQIFFL